MRGPPRAAEGSALVGNDLMMDTVLFRAPSIRHGWGQWGHMDVDNGRDDQYTPERGGVGWAW